MIPAVTLAYAQTLDGQMTAADGTSRWISNAASLVRTHQLRAAHDAIMVGIGTVLIDDPQLTVRLCAGTNPIRIIIDSQLRTPLTAQVVCSSAQWPTWLLHAPEADRARRAALIDAGVQCMAVPVAAGGGLDVQSALMMLAQAGVQSVMVEGGHRLMTSLLRAQCVTRMVVTIAPKLVGQGRTRLGDIGVATMADAYTLQSTQIDVCDGDIWIDGVVHYA
jgi:riboflavin-specific deaminase-like protein